MRITKRQSKLFIIVVLLTTALTWFYYAHETLPRSLRAATALLETPVAVASGLSYYLDLGIPVYDSKTAVILANLTASVIVVFVIDKIINRRSIK